ncbi:MAG: adenylate/guanylate cyclase domain-containing protein [Gemmatimonadetes bacterium]|nr:adenylate/guanylate cyclase domain-containing protein [Gemmatimonadota bacterium]
MSQVLLVSDYAATSGFANIAETDIELSLPIYLFASLATTVVGFTVGAVEVLYLNRLFATRSFSEKIIGKTAFYLVLMAGVILVTYPIAAAMEMDTSLVDARVWERLRGFLISKSSLSAGVQLTTSLIASLFYAEISEHLGHQVLTNFLTGRYHTPTVERRIFLFSDMKSSTQIAEVLGHARYFELLRAYYDSLADAIIDHRGEVYQYIGDEIVISWPEEKGLMQNECIRCVLRMKEDLRARAPWFKDRFGVVPGFKAGMQRGSVTTGEIGALKKEIVFTGDVLNQTARIQGLCSEMAADVLVAGELRARLGEGEGWTFRSLGTHELRGKEQAVELFALEVTTAPEGEAV